jgi:3D (Asp-Asp-Asp) domain-containing protein
LASAVATSYGPPWGGIQGGGTTATGIDLHGGAHKLIVAVDPSVIPLGTKLKIWPNPFGNRNLIFTAADTGGAIKGQHIDFYDWRGRTAQSDWGVKSVSYEVVGKGAPTAAATLGHAGAATTGNTAASSSGDAGGVAGKLGGPLLKGFLELAFVVGGAILMGVGGYRAANSTETGRRVIAAGKTVGKRTAEAGAEAAVAA